MSEHSRERIAIVGGGCAAMSAAFALSDPSLHDKYEITVYQLGWRLGGKGASGRGQNQRIEEHGLHIWLGFYENAFRLIRRCYSELQRNPEQCPIAKWEDAFEPSNFIGFMSEDERRNWHAMLGYFPPSPGKPGDTLKSNNPFTLQAYIQRTFGLLNLLLCGMSTGFTLNEPPLKSTANDTASLLRSLSVIPLSTLDGLSRVLTILEGQKDPTPVLTNEPAKAWFSSFCNAMRSRAYEQFYNDQTNRVRYEIIDMSLAIMTGILTEGLLLNAKGFDAIEDEECGEWLVKYGASRRSLESGFLRGLYDLALAYEEGDKTRPRVSAGQGIRGAIRMFFTYRGAIFWKMTSGMGDVVFAPLYEVLKARGVRFSFFHRLENVKMGVDESGHFVEALEFDIQAQTEDGSDYEPLIDVKGLPCWPSTPKYELLKDGSQLKQQAIDFESFWDLTKIDQHTIKVTEDFDYVVLGVGIGAIEHTCGEILHMDQRWRNMVQQVKTVQTQALQLWMNADMEDLGWYEPPTVVSGFSEPFDTWADMGHVVPTEDWPATSWPRSLAYFCGVLPDPPAKPLRDEHGYPDKCLQQVRKNSINYLNNSVGQLWPLATTTKGFRWDYLQTDDQFVGPERLDSQYYRANVNPSDRYTLSVPGSAKYRISPLDYTYDNLTIAGDWTACGFNEGCVEAAVMSGLLAAHAISGKPKLEEIVGYDSP